MKMHMCTEREAMEMITIITCLHQSSLGPSEKNRKGGQKKLELGLDSIADTFTGDRLISGHFHTSALFLDGNIKE